MYITTHRFFLYISLLNIYVELIMILQLRVNEIIELKLPKYKILNIYAI